jgi:DUF971 family protein
MPVPVDLRPVGQYEWLVSWDDGHRSLYSCRNLRYQCPCAGCVNEHTGVRQVRFEDVPEDIKIIASEAVGRYALRFTFSDSHATGIFGFDLLRSLCTCDACNKAP